MTTMDIVEIEPTEMLLKNMAKFPQLARYIEENNGEAPSCFFEEELISHEEFGEYLKETMYERFGIVLDLSPENLATFE